MRSTDERWLSWLGLALWPLCLGIAINTVSSVYGQQEASVAGTETATQSTTDATRLDAKPDAENDEEELQQVELADGRLTLRLPAAWEQVKPRSRIIEREFSVPPPEGERVAGRLTMMQSGGGVEANIERWKGQFTPAVDAASDEHSKVKKIEVAGVPIHVVDLSGTFLDQPGPFAPGTRRPGYRMLGAIIETVGAGDYYVKFYGPAATVEAHSEAFERTIRSLRWQDR